VHPELPVRIISLGDQVVQHRGLGAGDEAVPHPDRHVHRVVIGLAEGDLDVLAEGRGTDPQVHQDVDHLAGQATDEFRLPRWYFGQVDAPNDVPAAAGDVRLRDVEGISQVLGELGGAEALVEAAASVPENPWGEQPGTGDGEVDDGWLGGRVQGAEVNRQLCGTHSPYFSARPGHTAGAVGRGLHPRDFSQANFSITSPKCLAFANFQRMDSPHRSEDRRILGATLVGTTIEWYDFFIYAQAAGLVFGTQFFAPASSDNPSL